jgi:WD40 repeat protein
MAEPIAVLEAHVRHAQRAVFTTDGETLVTCGQDSIRLWKVPSFTPDGAFEGHEASVNTLSFSADGGLLASGSSDGTARIWSFPGGRELDVLDGQLAAAVSPAGGFATISTKARAVLWDGNYDQVATLPLLDRRLFSLAFETDGASLFVAGTGTVHRIDVKGRAKAGEYPGHQTAVTSMALSPDGTLLATTGSEGTLRLRRVAGGGELFAVRLGRPGTMQLAFAPDGAKLAVSIDFAIQIRSAADGTLLSTIEVPVKGVYGIGFSPDGRLLANAGADGRVRIWAVSRVTPESGEGGPRGR